MPALELVFHELAGPYPVEIIRGVQQVAQEHELAVAVAELGHQAPGRGLTERILARRPLGVIAIFSALTDEQVRQLHSRDIPFVLLDPVRDTEVDCPMVSASNWSGGLSATRHLLHLGHRRIATITGPPDSIASRARLDGFRAEGKTSSNATTLRSPGTLRPASVAAW